MVSRLSSYVVDHKNAEFVSGRYRHGIDGKAKTRSPSELGIWKKVQRGMAYWTVIVSAEEVAAPGFTATTDAVPAAARSAAGMATVRWVASTIVVLR